MKQEIYLFLENLEAELTSLLPRVLMAVVIILIGFIVASLVERLVRRFINYLDRSINLRLQANLLNVDMKASAAFISKTFFWIIMAIALIFCIDILRLDFLADWFELIFAYLPNIFASVVIFSAGIVAGRLLGDIIKSAASRTGIVNGEYMGRLVRYMVVFVAVVIAVNQLGVDIDFLTNIVTILLAILLLGAALAFGLGAQTSVKNILGAYYARKSYSIGTHVRINDVEGVIVKITDSAITIKTENSMINIPAKDFNELMVTVLKDAE